jgi:hypothetical protein
MGDPLKTFNTDAVSTALKRVTKSLGGVTRNAVVGDITRGEVVEVQVGTATATSGTGQATVGARRTGAVLIAIEMSTPVGQQFNWWIDGETLYVETSDTTKYGTLTFWVF